MCCLISMIKMHLTIFSFTICSRFICSCSGASKLGLSLTPASQPTTTAVTLGGLVTSTTSSSGTGFSFGALPTQTAASTQQSAGGFSFPGAKVLAPAATSAQSTPSFSLGGQSTGKCSLLRLQSTCMLCAIRKVFCIDREVPLPDFFIGLCMQNHTHCSVRHEENFLLTLIHF